MQHNDMFLSSLLNLLHLLGHHHGVGLSDLAGSHLLVVEGALVLIAVAVKWAVEAAATTGKA